VDFLFCGVVGRIDYFDANRAFSALNPLACSIHVVVDTRATAELAPFGDAATCPTLASDILPRGDLQAATRTCFVYNHYGS
jgi:hypothetical protein